MVLATTMPGILVNRLKEGLPMLDISTASNSCMIFMVGLGKSPNTFVRTHRTEVFYISGSTDDVLCTLNIHETCIVMLNMDAPEVGGVGMFLRLRTIHPDTRIFLVSESHKYLEPSVRLGASGYLHQSEVAKMLEHGKDLLLSREFIFSDRLIVDWITKEARRMTKAPVTSIRLTPREVEVLRLLARNSSDLQIAQILGIRHSTVNFHTRNIRRKLGVRSRVEAREFAIHEGYFDPSKTKGL